MAFVQRERGGPNMGMVREVWSLNFPKQKKRGIGCSDMSHRNSDKEGEIALMGNFVITPGDVATPRKRVSHAGRMPCLKKCPFNQC